MEWLDVSEKEAFVFQEKYILLCLHLMHAIVVPWELSQMSVSLPKTVWDGPRGLRSATVKLLLPWLVDVSRKPRA